MASARAPTRGGKSVRLDTLVQTSSRETNVPEDRVFRVLVDSIRGGELTRVRTLITERVKELIAEPSLQGTDIAKRVLLANEKRAAVYGAIERAPGSTFSQLRKATGLGSSTLNLYLNQLVNFELVGFTTCRASKLFHLPGVPAARVKACFFLGKRNFRRTVELLAGGPARIGDVSRELDLHHSTVAYILNWLVEEGLVDVNSGPYSPNREYRLRHEVRALLGDAG
ncbi:MAG: winged helix-turn-helix domain-containing protein [Promethearchaeota archaeon]